MGSPTMDCAFFSKSALVAIFLKFDAFQLSCLAWTNNDVGFKSLLKLSINFYP